MNAERHPRIPREMIDLASGTTWSGLEGYPGLDVMLLGDTLDEGRRTGARTRLVRFRPGARTHERLVHAYWEETLLVSGSLETPEAAGESAPVGEHLGADPMPGEVLRYSLRPPGTPHGPFFSPRGCLLFEVQYYLAD
ncbi:cupin [Cupriavidus nantongensis]|uniref:cupin n=1 Tax=Cupriavidus nantongensis TaxID=1796606 RepID=UPI00358F14D6